MATWPASLPRPTFDGYALDPLDPVLRTDMEAGSPRTRRRTRARNDRINVTWRMTDREMSVFRAWFDFDAGAAGGSAWFSILLAYGDLGLRTYDVKFSGIYKSTLQAGMFWTVTASLEVRGNDLTTDQQRGAVLGLITSSGQFPSLVFDFAGDKALDSRIAFTRASVATFFDAAGTMQQAAIGVARFDHDPLTGESLGLLLEEARTNCVFNTATTATSAAISTGTATGPDGALASKVVPNLGAVAFPARGSLNAQTTSIADLTIGASRSVVFTGYFAPTGPLNYQPYLVIGAHAGGASVSYALVLFDALTGTFNAPTLNAGWVQAAAPSAVLMPCGMWRVDWRLTFTQDATLRDSIGVAFQIHDHTDASSYTADGVSGVQYSCMQLEVGAYPTSYIPTTTAAATRTADVATMTGANFSSWFNPVAGTFIASNRLDYVGATSEAAAACTVSDGTSNNRMVVASRSGVGATPQIIVVAGGVTQAGPYVGNIVAGTPFKFAAAYNLNDFACALDGAQTANSTDNSGSVPAVNQLRFGAANSVARHWTARLVYYPARLSNTELMELTRA